MNDFKKFNRIIGWGVFVVAAVTYLLTIEPSASLWDCAEFIATSAKLEVGHPPGAPLWMMLARFFAMLAPSPQYAGLMVNAMSAICGAFTVLFLFWSITHLGRRMSGEKWTVLGAGIVGALAYCFSDTQWFSAVEAEVYSMSSMFTAMVFLCILKWEEADINGDRQATRWLVLIAYLMGLSIGIHILNLLCIPAIVLVWYFRKTPQVKGWGVVKALLVSGAILLAINGIIMPLSVRIGAAFDKWFVNGMNLPVNSGMIFWCVIVAAACVAGLWLTRKKQMAHTIVLCTTFILIGYSSYASTVIRAAADPPMNSNNPGNPYGLLKLLSREQYGRQPLLKGQWFSSPQESVVSKKETWLGVDGKYHSTERMSKAIYPDEMTTVFPRMWNPDRAEGYKQWTNMKGRTVTWDGEQYTVPTMAENMRFFFGYQLNFMYWRYFLWNFVGRQNEIQGDGGPLYGNWLSGVKPVDAAYLGPQDDLPSELAANKGRNVYFFLPFLLGLVGLFFQLNRDRRGFVVVMMLFVMMGVALVVYFNSSPGEPRERDYIYVGSFYAFCIWIGLGVMAIQRWLERRRVPAKVATAAAIVACTAGVPLLMACQNWDDHDRSHKTVVRDFGHNALVNTLPNSIVLNYGDNDTFPLWYAQEVDGVRPDVRIMNTSYLGADWYVEEMTHKYNDSDPVPFSLPPSKYMGTNDALVIYERTQDTVSVRELMDFIASDDPGTKVQIGDTWEDYVPVTTLYLPVNKENALKSGIVRPEDAHLMVDSLPMKISGSMLYKSDMMVLDLLATFDWSRPLYFIYPHAFHDFGLDEYKQYDGFGYRLVPIKSGRSGRVDADYLWTNLMERDHYGNINHPRALADYTTQYMYNEVFRVRDGFAQLAENLLARGDTLRAVQALDRAVAEVPYSKIRDYMDAPSVIMAYFEAGEMDKGNAILEEQSRIQQEYINYFLRFRGEKGNQVMRPLGESLRKLQDLYQVALAYDQKQHLEPMEEIFKLFDI